MEMEGTPLHKERKIHKFAGRMSSDVYGVHNHSYRNVRRGLMERVFNVERGGKLVPTPKPTLNDSVFKSRLSAFKDAVTFRFPIAPKLSYDEFLSYYTGPKLRTYQRAVESLMTERVGRADSYLTTFVKAEKINLTKKSDPAPRVIQPRNPRYNVEIGRYLRHTEHLLFQRINKIFDVENIGEKTIFKGMDATQAGEAMKVKSDRFSNPVYLGLDASRFDQHCSKQILEFEHSIWMSICGGDRKLLNELLDMQLNNRGIARVPGGCIKYQVEGCRMSGDINTSSGNCLIMCALIWTYMRSIGVHDYALANNGDDCVLIFERRNLRVVSSELSTFFTSFGYTMQVEDPKYHFEQVEFCQASPVFVDGVWNMIRIPRTVLGKDMHCVTDVYGKVDEWLYAVKQGGLASYSDVPVLGAFYKSFEPTVNHSMFSTHNPYAFKHRTSGSVISEETRYSFWCAFGVTPDEQVALETSFPVVTSTVNVDGDYSYPHIDVYSRA